MGFLLGQVENHRTGLLATQQDCWKRHSSDGRFSPQEIGKPVIPNQMSVDSNRREVVLAGYADKMDVCLSDGIIDLQILPTLFCQDSSQSGCASIMPHLLNKQCNSMYLSTALDSFSYLC